MKYKNVKFQGVWREPDEESVGLYPGLVVDDGRQTGSITVGRSRLPIWAFIGQLVSGIETIEHTWEGYRVGEYGLPPHDLGTFLYNLMEQRGEFGRLLLILADVERREGDNAWWEVKRQRNRVRKALDSCLAALDQNE